MIEQKILRIIDVNLNRTKEGLRVIEEYFRFCENNNELMLEIRDIRHKLDNVSKKIYDRIILARDINTDFGKDIVEKKREDIKEILIANIKRIEEGLRVLEEYIKFIDEEYAFDLKGLRFRAYNLEQLMFKKII